MKKLVCFSVFCFCLVFGQDTSKLSNETSPLNEPAHIISITLLNIGNTMSKSQVEAQINQLNQMLDYKRINGYQPIRLKLEKYEAFSLAQVNDALKKQCVGAENFTKEAIQTGNLTSLRSLRFWEHPKSLMVYCFPLKVDENFREQSMEPLEPNDNMVETISLGAGEPDYENDYLIIAPNMTLARSFGKYLGLSDAWDEYGNVGQSLEDVGKHGSWKKGSVDERKDRNNAMDQAQEPYYFTLSQLKTLYSNFLDRQSEDYLLKEEKGSAYFLDSEDLHALGKKHVEFEEYEKALKYFFQAAKLGNIKSYYGIAYLHDNELIENASPSIAIKYYKKSAEGGLVEAQFRLGLIYEYGMGSSTKPNIEEAQKYWKMAADKGHGESKDKLEFYQGMKPIKSSEVGSYYSQGMHAYYDGQHRKAIKSFYLASMHNHNPSIYFLGLCYYEGKGVPSNIIKAKELWESISEDQQAQYGLGLVYLYGGKGVEKDVEVSYEWFAKAAEQGHGAAKQMLKKFERK